MILSITPPSGSYTGLVTPEVGLMSFASCQVTELNVASERPTDRLAREIGKSHPSGGAAAFLKRGSPHVTGSISSKAGT